MAQKRLDPRELIKRAFQLKDNLISGVKNAYSADLNRGAAGTQSIQGLVQGIARSPQQLTPFTATSFLGNNQINAQDFWKNAGAGGLQTLSLGTFKPGEAPQTLAGQVGRVGGQMAASIPLYGGVMKGLSAIPAIGKGSRLIRTAADIVGGAGVMAATTPGSIQERLQVAKGAFTDPTNLALSLAFPVGSTQIKGGLRAIGQADEAVKAGKKGLKVKPSKGVGEITVVAKNGEKTLRVRSDAPRKVMVQALKTAKKEGRRLEVVAPEIKGGSLPKGKLLLAPKQMLQLPSGPLPRVGQVGDFKGTVRNFVGNRSASRTISNQVASEFADVPVAKGQEFINHVEGVAKSSDPFINQKASRWNDLTNELYGQLQTLAKRTKQDLGYMQGYVTHIWKEAPEEVSRRVADLRKKSGFAETRKIMTYQEGIDAGLTPMTTNPAEIMQVYVNNLKTLEANLNFVDDLKASGFLSGVRQGGYEPVVIPGISSSSKLFYAPKAIAEKITNIFRQESVFSGMSKVAGQHQNITMSGGVPFTNINAWTMGQVIKDLTTFSPWRTYRTAKNFIRSNFPKMSRQYFLEKVDDIIQLQRRGVEVNPDLDVSRMIDKGTIKNIFGEAPGEALNAAISDATFKRFAPMQVIEHFRDIKNQAIKSGMGKDEAADVAADAVRRYFGLPDMADVVTRNKELNDLTNTFLFAPRFRESMINFWVNNVKAISPIGRVDGRFTFNNPLSLKNRANTMFMAGTVMTVYAYDKMNKAINGHPMSENPPGMEDKLIIPQKDGSYVAVPILPSLATIPRLLYKAGIRVKEGDVGGLLADLKGLLSTAVRPVADVITNQDWAGNPIYDPDSKDQTSQIGGYLGRELIAHPYIKELTDPRNQGDPLWQRATRASEAPLRFYDAKTINGKWFYAARDQAMKGMDSKTRKQYELLHPSKQPWETTVSTPDTVSVKKKMENATLRANNPELFLLERRIATATAKNTGQALDPLYSAPVENALTYFRYQSLAPGSQDAKDMYKAFPEIGVISQARSAFFEANPIPKTGDEPASPYDAKPRPSEYVQQQMDLQNWADPQVKSYLDANAAWVDEQRMLLGMTPTSKYGGYGTKKGKKISVPSVKLNKIPTKKYKPKAVKLQASSKQYKVKKLQVKPIKVKL